MEKKRNTIIRNLVRNCVDAVKEFPVALFYLTVFAVVIAVPDLVASKRMTFCVPCLMACLGSLGASLTTYGKGRGIQLAGQAVALLLSFLYLLLFDKSGFFKFGHIQFENHLEILSSTLVYLAVLITIVFFPFSNSLADDPDKSWSTSMRRFVGVMRAGLVAIAVLIAMTVITFAGYILLNVTIFGKFWLTFVPTMLFGSLSIASFSVRKSSEKPLFRLAPFSKGIFTLVSVPLLAIYLLIFYIYLVDVLVRGIIPVRDLSFLAVRLFVAFCAQRFLFQQALREGDNVVAQWFNRLSPWLLLLPTAMMSWVIGHRLMQYGMTVSRVYVLLINLWMYGIIAWWIVSRGWKVWIIPVSLCAVFSLATLTCLNVTTVTEASMRADLRKGMEAAGWQLPVSDSFFRQNAWNALTAEQRSRKTYLEEEMGICSLEGLVTFPYSRVSDSDSDDKSPSDTDSKRIYVSSKCVSTFDSVPDGCVAVNIDSFNVKDLSLAHDSVIVSIGDYGSIMFSLEQLQAADGDKGGINKLTVIGSDGKIKGGSISNLYLSADIDEGGFRNDVYCYLSGTIFMEPEAAGKFINEKK
ncbi:MAG: DUF4153 domain-containing protein [Muribaculaceae bacterium]|nr:DUF4153 domain-containing protein [Muribaculaceae bacterium]